MSAPVIIMPADKGGNVLALASVTSVSDDVLVLVDGADTAVTALPPVGYSATVGDRVLVTRVGSATYIVSHVA
jgi:hypothetical protein